MIYTIKISSSSCKSLHLYLWYLKKIFNKLNLQNSIFFLPTIIKKIHLLKSPHVYKKAKEHFEIRTYRKKIVLKSSIQIEKLKILFLNKPKSIKLIVAF